MPVRVVHCFIYSRLLHKKALLLAGWVVALLTVPVPGWGQPGKREVPLPEAGRFYSMPPAGGMPLGMGPLYGSQRPLPGQLEEAYRLYYPRQGGGRQAEVINGLYREHFNSLRQLELKPGTADTTWYALNYNLIYSLKRGTDRQLVPTLVARLPFNSTAMCKGPNGDLYLASVNPNDSRHLYRFDPRRKRLYRSNISLPLLQDPTDWWLSGASHGQALYFLNKAGTNLVEIAPGRIPRNLLGGAIREGKLPEFLGRAMNLTIGPDRTFYLKENFTPRMWIVTEKDGRLTIHESVALSWEGVTGSITLLPGRGKNLRFLLGERNDADPQLVEYDMGSGEARLVARVGCTDLAATPHGTNDAAWPAGGRVSGWYRGSLYADYQDRGTIGLLFRAGGRIDSVQLGSRRLGVAWHYRTRGNVLELAGDPGFTEYVTWYGGGRVEADGKGTLLTLALQSSVFDALWQGGAPAFPYSAGTEGFTRLTNLKAAEAAPVAEPPPPVPVAEPAPPPPVAEAAPRPPAVVRDSLACEGAGEVEVAVSDSHVVDGDQVQFYLGDRPISDPIRLKKRPTKFRFACPPAGTRLVMYTLLTGQGPCTAKVVVKQGKKEKIFRLQSSARQASALRFFGR